MPKYKLVTFEGLNFESKAQRMIDDLASKGWRVQSHSISISDDQLTTYWILSIIFIKE